MKKLVLLFASTLLLTGSTAFAQQQYDSLGSPTPAPNQSASPNAIAPNIPSASGKGAASKPASPETTGAGPSSTQGGTLNTGTSTPTDNGTTPSGLTPE
jgi:hypothetical protein